VNTLDILITVAKDVLHRAYAPYSKFHVGAALETAEGKIVSGCNVESACYGLTICAERVAIVKAVSEGMREFTRIAVVTDTEKLTPPCGSCRQLLWEFAPDCEVILANGRGKVESHRLRDLLPLAFEF
jgi:cytidine deaminase